MLLDTHAIVWLDRGERIAPRVRGGIEAARKLRRVWISTLSVYEIGALHARGRIRLPLEPDAWIELFRMQFGVRLAYPTVPISLDAARLPRPIRGDPVDRLLIATARALDVPLVTRDGPILAFAEATGAVRVLPC